MFHITRTVCEGALPLSRSLSLSVILPFVSHFPSLSLPLLLFTSAVRSYFTFVQLYFSPFGAGASSLSMTSSIRSIIFVIAATLLLSVKGDTSSDAVVGSFGPLATFQPVENWLYPSGQPIPVCASLGNASLALYDFPRENKTDHSSLGFQMTYGVAPTSTPEQYIHMDSLTVQQYDHMFNFTGNLLSNTFWWNYSIPTLPDGSYVLKSSASFFSCTPGTSDGILSLVSKY